ncbi:MAG: hypothetical protein AABY53_02705 [Bdellovibrionota bacterium]
MKTVFLVIVLVATQLKAQTSGDKLGGVVDKGYQHQLMCKAVAGNQEYELQLQWKNKLTHHDPPGRAPFRDEGFSYELKKVATGQIWVGGYNNYFNERIIITDLLGQLNLSGYYHMFKRIGEMSNTTELALDKKENNFYLTQMILTAGQTYFDNYKDYCDVPVSKLCGVVPPYRKVVLDLSFENSTCEYIDL